MNFINLTIPEHSYLLGFLQADGHLQRSTGQKGKLTIELSRRDKDIL